MSVHIEDSCIRYAIGLSVELSVVFSTFDSIMPLSGHVVPGSSCFS